MYPIDRRYIACNIYSMIKSLRKTATLVNVSHTTVARWIKDLTPKVYNNSQRQYNSKAFIINETIRSIILINPMITHKEIKIHITNTFNFTISSSLIRTVLRTNLLTRKKARFFGLAKNQQTTTEAFLSKRKIFINENRLFFSLDETSFGRHGMPTYGYCKKGEQLRIQKTIPRVTTSSVMAIVSQTAIIKTEIIHGSFNSISFLEFMKSLDIPNKSVILLDNVRFHYSKAVAQFAETRQWDLCFVPPYSPWFNPIEGVFSIMKRAYYKDCSINDSINKVTSSHLQAFFRHSLNHCGFKNIST